MLTSIVDDFIVDGRKSPIEMDFREITFINIPSFAAGTNLWKMRKRDAQGGKKFQPQALDDGLLEVVGISSINHMMNIRTGASKAHKLVQASSYRLKISTDRPYHIQIDGEAREFTSCRIAIDLLRRQPVVQFPEDALKSCCC